MKNVLFLQSDVQDPYALYAERLMEAPVYFDEDNSIAAVYRYALCKQILCSHQAFIPSAPADNGLNEIALQVKSKLVRLSNAAQHEIARRVSMELFSTCQPVEISGLMEVLIGSAKGVDWVRTVAKKLPMLALLKSFQFSEDNCRYFLDHIEALTKIMLPKATVEPVQSINNISDDIYHIMEMHLTTSSLPASLKGLRENNSLLPHYISNLTGLLIQSYDACRGLLSNALLQVLQHNPGNLPAHDPKFFTDSVVETLRYDPPVHNTRRILQEDLMLENTQLKKGQSILLVLASANRDPAVFEAPCGYNIGRTNNSSHLTFGTGAHACIAAQWVVPMTADALFWLFNRYSRIELLSPGIQYEPAVNVRLPVEIPVSLAR